MREHAIRIGSRSQTNPEGAGFQIRRRKCLSVNVLKPVLKESSFDAGADGGLGLGIEGPARFRLDIEPVL